MFVTIRRYSPKNGAVNKASLQLLRRQLQEEFLPLIQQIQGFVGYYVLNVGDREVITLNFCGTKEGSAEASRFAAEYTLRNPLLFELGRPEVSEGEVLTFVEGARQVASTPSNGGGAAAAALALWFEESRAILLSASER